MRHVATLLAALIIAPLSWLLIAFGQDRSVAAFVATGGGELHAGGFVRPLQFLAAAGLLLGLIATLRFSPLGALVSGAGYLSSYALLLVAPNQVLKLFSHTISVAGHPADLATPVRTGTTLLVGALLVVGAASVGRWRQWPRQAGEASDTGGTQDRPVGADGLGLFPPNREPNREPDRDPGGEFEPAFTARHSTEAEAALSGDPRSRFSTSPRGESERAHW